MNSGENDASDILAFNYMCCLMHAAFALRFG